MNFLLNVGVIVIAIGVIRAKAQSDSEESCRQTVKMVVDKCLLARRYLKDAICCIFKHSTICLESLRHAKKCLPRMEGKHSDERLIKNFKELIPCSESYMTCAKVPERQQNLPANLHLCAITLTSALDSCIHQVTEDDRRHHQSNLCCTFKANKKCLKIIEQGKNCLRSISRALGFQRKQLLPLDVVEKFRALVTCSELHVDCSSDMASEVLSLGTANIESDSCAITLTSALDTCIHQVTEDDRKRHQSDLCCSFKKNRKCLETIEQGRDCLRSIGNTLGFDQKQLLPYDIVEKFNALVTCSEFKVDCTSNMDSRGLLLEAPNVQSDMCAITLTSALDSCIHQVTEDDQRRHQSDLCCTFKANKNCLKTIEEGRSCLRSIGNELGFDQQQLLPYDIVEKFKALVTCSELKVDCTSSMSSGGRSLKIETSESQTDSYEPTRSKCTSTVTRTIEICNQKTKAQSPVGQIDFCCDVQTNTECVQGSTESKRCMEDNVRLLEMERAQIFAPELLMKFDTIDFCLKRKLDCSLLRENNPISGKAKQFLNVPLVKSQKIDAPDYRHDLVTMPQNEIEELKTCNELRNKHIEPCVEKMTFGFVYTPPDSDSCCMKKDVLYCLENKRETSGCMRKLYTALPRIVRSHQRNSDLTKILEEMKVYIRCKLDVKSCRKNIEGSHSNEPRITTSAYDTMTMYK